ncbi:serine hydrolase [Micromonospora sp. BRA006-A]|nr:serine hydrolase [Micromonospora sp. BRA006-A]
MRVFDPEHTSSSTARELTRLLRLVWRDEAGPAPACAMVRELMARQLFWTRLAAGFPPGVRVAGKTGTLPGLHLEAGVAEYPDGRRYAIAVAVRTERLAARRIDVDLAMGRRPGLPSIRCVDPGRTIGLACGDIGPDIGRCARRSWTSASAGWWSGPTDHRSRTGGRHMPENQPSGYARRRLLRDTAVGAAAVTTAGLIAGTPAAPPARAPSPRRAAPPPVRGAAAR